MARPKKNLQSETNSDNTITKSNLSPVTAPMGAPLDSTPVSRPKRIPIGTKGRLSFPQRAGFVRRIFNDKDGRIEQALDAGYTFVEDKDATGTSTRSKDPSQLGAQVRRAVGKGTTGVLMEIQEDLYHQDQDVKIKRNNKILEEVKKPKDEHKELIKNVYGQVQSEVRST